LAFHEHMEHFYSTNKSQKMTEADGDLSIYYSEIWEKRAWPRLKTLMAHFLQAHWCFMNAGFHFHADP